MQQLYQSLISLNQKLDLELDEVKVSIYFVLLKICYFSNPSMRLFCGLIELIYALYIKEDGFVNPVKVLGTYFVLILLIIF